ncbi:MAG: TonB-dependent receptor, partial [Acetobacteraceae bacterium]
MRNLALTLAGGLAAAALANNPAQAQQAIPDTIVTATRVPTPAERVPAAITVITRQDIEERGYQSLAEALTAVPGINLVGQGGLGGQTSAFTRGTNSSHTLVLLDGVPINDASTPAGAFNFGQDLLGNLDRIEVVRGPAASLYGSAALGGVINLVTRQAPQGKVFAPFGEIAGGSNSTVRGNLGATGRVEAFDYLFSGQSLSTRGSNALAPRLQTTNGERDGFRGQSTMARLGWTPVEGTRLEGIVQWRQNNFGLDGTNNAFRQADDSNYSGEDRRWFGQVRGETRL